MGWIPARTCCRRLDKMTCCCSQNMTLRELSVVNFDNARQDQGMIQQHLSKWDTNLYLIERAELINWRQRKPFDGWYLAQSGYRHFFLSANGRDFWTIRSYFILENVFILNFNVLFCIKLLNPGKKEKKNLHLSSSKLYCIWPLKLISSFTLSDKRGSVLCFSKYQKLFVPDI